MYFVENLAILPLPWIAELELDRGKIEFVLKLLKWGCRFRGEHPFHVHLVLDMATEIFESKAKEVKAGGVAGQWHPGELFDDFSIDDQHILTAIFARCKRRARGTNDRRTPTGGLRNELHKANLSDFGDRFRSQCDPLPDLLQCTTDFA
jgi:hypothetical protein